jgi:hypothetical protein
MEGLMPYSATRRLYSLMGRKVAKYFNYRKAKRLYNVINRDMAFFETRYLKSRLHHA